MSYFWSGLGWAMVILAFSIGFRSCEEHKPFVGNNGIIVDTLKT